MIRPDIWNDAEFASRFWAKAERRGADECWPWNGKAIRGRGAISYRNSDFLAPRIVRVLQDQGWPALEMFACHSCDNPNCVNPGHIWWGTAFDNLADARSKGRLGGRQKGSETECRNGHPRTDDNTRLTNGGAIVCRVCTAARQKRWKQRTSQVPKPCAQPPQPHQGNNQ